MLVLSRKSGEKIQIGDELILTVSLARKRTAVDLSTASSNAD